MIEVILPNRGPHSEIADSVISAIVSRLYGVNEYTTTTEDRRDGRYIKIREGNGQFTHFVCLSKKHANEGRNSRLMQYVSPAYVDYKKFDGANKDFNIFVIDPDHNDRTNYSKMFYRCFLTMGIKILNEDELGLADITPFESYDDLKSYRNKTSERNTHNQQTYFVDESNDRGINQISIYGKTFGANAMESFILALTLVAISDKVIVFYQVVDNGSKSLSEDQIEILEEEGIDFGETIELDHGKVKVPITRETSRDTPLFHFNLLEKYGEKRCYICGCDIEHMIIGSHIERVTDIDHNESYSIKEKNRRATDGDNGFWLCANHDKMFEYGIIYFNDRELKVGSFVQDDNDRNYISYSFGSIGDVYSNNLESTGETQSEHFMIKTNHYNDNMANYIHKHKERVTSANILR